MRYDVFFSISQTPVDGVMPSEAEMFRRFFEQVEAADALGYGVAWVAEAHLSTQVQKEGPRPVVPHWEGEIGLNTDIFQLSHAIFRRTRRIETGSAVMNILTMGGPIAAAEKVATFLTLHGLDPEERRRVHVGFAGGRFEFMNRPFGVVPRDPVEEAAWPVIKGRVLREAGEIFLRLLRGEAIGSDDVTPPADLTRADFRSDEDWARVQAAAGTRAERIPVRRRYVFDRLRIVPADWRRELLVLVAGTHDPATQVFFNRFLPVRVFNLSITRPEVIEATHARMRRAFHPDGGPWRRGHMPRTTFVFLNARPGLTDARRSEAARREARAALSAYWKALEGTIDPARVERAADNALVGNPDEVARQVVERFHPDDRLMLWFDFFRPDPDRVVADMEDFMRHVAPRVEALLERPP